MPLYEEMGHENSVLWATLAKLRDYLADMADVLPQHPHGATSVLPDAQALVSAVFARQFQHPGQVTLDLSAERVDVLCKAWAAAADGKPDAHPLNQSAPIAALTADRPLS